MLLVKYYTLSLPSPQSMSSNIQQLPSFSGPLKSLYSLFSIPLLPFSSGPTPIRFSIPGLGSCQNQQRPSHPRAVFSLLMYQLGNLFHLLWYIFFTVLGNPLSLFYISLVCWFLPILLTLNTSIASVLYLYSLSYPDHVFKYHLFTNDFQIYIIPNSWLSLSTWISNRISKWHIKINS